MKKLTFTLLIMALGFSSCTKVYRCECYGGASTIAYKPGTETAAKEGCEKAGCKFVNY